MVLDTKERNTPPYIGWATWHRLLEGLKTFIPPYVDRSYFDSLGFSGTQYSQAVRTLSFLGLITEAKKPTEKLQLLVATNNSNDHKRMFREILQDAYRPFFDNPGPQNATIGALEEYLRSIGAKGVVDKCVTFFLAAAKEADIPLSPQLAGELGRRVGRGLRTPRKATSKHPARTTSIERAIGQTEILSSDLAQSLVEKFPDFDPKWSDDIRLRWFEAFQELLKRIK